MKLKKGNVIGKMAKKHVLKKGKKNLAKITTDEFMNQDFENDDDDEKPKTQNGSTKLKKVKKSSQFGVPTKSLKVTKNPKTDITKSAKKMKKKQVSDEQQDANDSDSGASDLDPDEHKKSLMNLKDFDPEFFNYLKTHDSKLLDFNIDDDDDDVSAGGDEMRHIPDDDLEVASDESDYEGDGETTETSGGAIKVNLKLIKTWQEELQTDKSAKTIKCVVEAFHAALEMVCDTEPTTKYRVDGGAIFNEIVQLCVMLLPTAFKKFLKLGEGTRFEAHKAKRFPKVKRLLKSYLSDLIRVLENISSADIISVQLKHLHQMLPYTQSFSSLRKPLLRVLLKFWSKAEDETVRVLAFMCIVKIGTSQVGILHGLSKTMYIKYVENSKFVSPTTLPGINFMRRSLVEIYSINNEVSYQNAFLYIRQLAIHLRNALTLKKKEHFQAVYNWQYVNSLWFWSELITVTRQGTMMRSLLYPLVQVIIGVIKLIPTWQYYPLRFHCIKMLINISKQTGVVIPILPFLTQILEDYDFNKRHKVVSMKPMSLMCLLRVSKSQGKENAYKDALIENMYELILECAAKDSHYVYFPDMYVLCVVKLKEFLKKCHVANYCRKMKQLLDKIEEGRQYLANERARQTFELTDKQAIECWEARMKQANPPVVKFYDSWIKVHQSQKLKLLTQNEANAADFGVPSIKRKRQQQSNAARDSDEDSDNDIPVEEMERRLEKDRQRKKEKKNKTKKAKLGKEVELPTSGDDDIVEDIKGDEWD
ncbi:hypothetical protein QAD02_011418 [Eretmocerus hayati]|uniref:Uncharacterized protein n=1 Tax=Eretmocerus hayati TaxID=131215 RepID=A0ACC2NWY9_9HYME|nr:hypothetical protein QAD02_011418 [Eretmocerus hayati]